MATEEATLIARILAGETEEFRHLMRMHGGTLLAFIEGVVGSHEEAEDVVQEAFLSAYRSLSQWDGRIASFATWLHRIAYHEALRHLKRKRLPTLSWDEHGRLYQYADEVEADEWMADATEEQWKRLDEAIDRLPSYDQMLLRLYYEDDLPLKEIAYILDSEAGTLASRLRRIRNRLQKEMQSTKNV